jgi:predicted enzyme related to lactoylglutathione lyase
MDIAMNSICHWDIPSTDFDKSQAFYGALFGWKFQPMPEQNYLLFMVEGGVGGGFNKVEKVSNDGIQVYILVEDIEATLAKVAELGGKTVIEKLKIGGGDHGYLATFTDSCGAQIGLWAKS